MNKTDKTVLTITVAIATIVTKLDHYEDNGTPDQVKMVQDIRAALRTVLGEN